MGPYEANVLELRLLMCSLSGSKIQDSELHPNSEQSASLSVLHDAVAAVVLHIENGDFIYAINGKAVVSLLWEPYFKLWELATTIDELYQSLRAHVLSFINGVDLACDGARDELLRSRGLLVMAVGVAALLAFWQANVTGPSVSYPSFPLLDQRRIHNDEDECNAWAKKQLMVDGCDVLGSCYIPQYLIWAKILLLDTLRATKGSKRNEGELGTNSLWAFRALLAHQKVLADRSPSLRSALTALESELLVQFGRTTSSSEIKQVTCVNSEIFNIITTAVQLECGIAEYTYSHVDSARDRLEAAKEACGLHLSLTGVLGFRTAHQVHPKPQMVLVANTLGSNKFDKTSLGFNKLYDTERVNASSRASMEDDILMAPKLVGSGTQSDPLPSDDWNEPRVLNSVQQAVILAQCLDIKKSNPDDELRGWQMAPFIEAVDTQQSSHFMVKSCCQLFRIRWECTRSRTRERALLMMEQLVNDIRENARKDWDRMYYAFCVNFPTLSVLLQEYAELMVRSGLIRDALRIFEELELWNNLIDCYCLLGKKAAAVDLIKERLQIQPDDARLWCALGDVTLNEECYYKAWEVSHHRFARAQRSLGKAAYNKSEYSRSIKHWEAALTLNSLHPDGWFALGSAALKAGDLNKALDSFTRAVQLDPDNGEAWNNIAAIHMTKKSNKEAYTAFREALKFRRSSWQMWENFAHVALDIQNFGQAIEALQTVLDLTQEKRVNLDCLTKLMEEVEARSDSTDNCPNEGRTIQSEHNMVSNLSESVKSSSISRGNGICKGNSKEMEQASVERTGAACGLLGNEKGQDVHLHDKEQSLTEREWLTERVGKLLSRVVQNCQDGAVWGLLARWHRVRDDLTMCSEALLKQVRSLQGSDWLHNRDRFENLCHASLQLCGTYMEIASRSRSKRELHQAQMLLRNIIKQGENFSNTDDYVALESCLKNIQLRIQALQ